MFYCDECAQKNKWPHSFSASRGNCEVCGKNGRCNDVPSSELTQVGEILEIKKDEFLVLDADIIGPETAEAIAIRTKHFVILVKGGKKNIDTIDRKSLRAVLDATETK